MTMEMNTNIIKHVETAELEAQVNKALSFGVELTAAGHNHLQSNIAADRDGRAWTVALSDLRVLEDFNVRVKNAAYWEHIESIAQSILENGWLPEHPIAGFLAKEGKRAFLYVTDGHCRIEAVHLANKRGAHITSLPVVLKDKSTGMDDLTVALVRSNSGKSLTPLELAIVCKRLIGFRWTPEKIAKKIGFTEEYVQQLLTVAGAPQAIRDAIEADRISVGLSKELIQKHGSEAPAVLAAAMERATAAGKTKVTAKFLPSKLLMKAQVKSAPVMYTAIEKIKSDAGFAGLADDVQAMVLDILKKVSESVPQEKAADGDTGGATDTGEST